jgi:hypothetical protein
LAGSFDPFNPYGYAELGPWNPANDPVARHLPGGAYRITKSGRMATVDSIGRGFYVKSPTSHAARTSAKATAAQTRAVRGLGLQASSPIGTTGRQVQVGRKNAAAGNPKGGTVYKSFANPGVKPKSPVPARAKLVAKVAGPSVFSKIGAGIRSSISPLSNTGSAPGGTPGASTGGAQTMPGLSDLQGLLNDLGQPISLASKNGVPTAIGALLNSMTAPLSLTGDQLAAAQYDPIISGLQTQQQVQGRQAAQNMADIQNWYGQVVKAAQSAQSADAAAGAALPGAIENISKDLAASIGGSANPGAGSVLASGTNDAAFAQSINASQSKYDNLIPALLQEDQAATSQREQGMNQQAALALAMQLAQAQGQKAALALTTNQSIEQQNKQLEAQKLQEMLGIKQYNNQLLGQRANTKLAIAQMLEAAPSLGLKSALTQADIAKIYSGIQHQTVTDKLNWAKYLSQSGLNSAREKYYGLQGMKIVNGILTARTGGGKPVKVNLSTLGNAVAGKFGVGKDFRIPAATWNSGNAGQLIATTIGSYLQSAGLTKGSNEYRRLAAELYSSFKDPLGRPLRPGAGWWK